jgi:phenylalanyl-tRNA synthetase beta chain|tara:strand:+ start:390 stop:2300 length:1911 start_codon:yes stop_codon:yes gene_type:complete
MKISYSHLVSQIKENPSIEMISESLFQLGHEHEIDGDILNMELTPNRGDCLSVNGILRDLSVFYNVDFKGKIYNEKIDKLQLDFENLSQNICPKISFLKIEIDKIPKEYNQYLNDYFMKLHLNKNNFFTDISNYLSYETGQPTHCYDASKINGKLVLQESEINQEFHTLLDKKITLSDKNSFFSINDEVVNLAGVVGGKSTACTLETKTVLVECAFFEPEAIIGKSLKYDIQSEASHKFERFVDPESHDYVIRRFVNIVSEHANIKDMSFISYEHKKKQAIKIPVNIDKINKILGTDITEDQYVNYLSKLGFIINDNLINVPSYRNDISSQNDLSEEVARIIGYDNIPKQKLPLVKGKTSDTDSVENKLRFFLLDHGFYEVINFPFSSEKSIDSIKIDNPLDSNKEHMRTNLTNSLLENLAFNERRQKDSIKFFEISDVYTLENNKVKKKRNLAIVASGRVGHNHIDFSKKISKKYLTNLFKDALPSEDFAIKIFNRDGLNSKIKNEIVGCEIDIDNFSTEVLNYKEETGPPSSFKKFSQISDLPFSSRDLSFSIKDFSNRQNLEDYILGYENELLREKFIFDFFYNENSAEIKIGYRFIFQSLNSTITEAQINNVMNDIIGHTVKIKGVTIPGLN